LEGADIVFPRLGFAEGSVTLVLILALVGFPIAVYLAWVYDITPDGIYRTPPLGAGERHHFSAARVIEFLVIAVLVAVVGFLYMDRLTLKRQVSESSLQPDVELETTDPAQYRSIAVLPFDDMSETGDQEWFAEGIAEELLHGLAAVDGLRVMARTSSFAFKNTNKTIAEIADILGVQAVLEGSVRRSGERVRITAQLVDTSTGYHIWSGSYERQLNDIFKLQDELARAVIEALRIELGVDRARPLVVEQTVNTEAYGWFMRGRAVLDWPNQQRSALAIRHFERAVEADPDYALAWGYLAYAQLMSQIWRPFSEASAAAIPAYERALALDPEQSEALSAKALVIQIMEHDWKSAGEIYQRAMGVRGNPNAMVTYALFYLEHIGQGDRAEQIFLEAEKRDPLHAGYKANLANLFTFHGDFEKAAGKAREALKLEPQHQFALMALIDAYTAAKNHAGVEDLLEQLPLSLKEHPRIRARVALNLLAHGNAQGAREIYQELLRLDPVSFSQGSTVTAVLATNLGEIEKAIDIMESTVDKNMWNQFWTASLLRHHDALREHPRYLAHLKRMNLDDESIAQLHRSMKFDRDIR
jgi:TolB-like protein/Tfp pilus assembly protein PilF